MPDHFKVLDLLQQGQWHQAHALVQEDESAFGCWLHGIVHIQEGDLTNARYWYRRAQRAWPNTPDVNGELAALRRALATIETKRGQA
jgi:hypothetical protein